MKPRCLIVGAGFSGAVLAERLASQCGIGSLVIDRRSHIAGNAYDCCDSAGILLHEYGPHYFRTNSDRIVQYLSAFTQWHPVEYKILSWAEGRYWPFPVNLNTFEQFIGRSSTSEEMQSTLDSWKESIPHPENSEEIILSKVGRRFYELFYKNYTIKKWNLHPSELDASVCGRIPIRTNRDDRYLSERFQALPREGYTRMFERMLDHPLIELRLRTDYREVAGSEKFLHTIYTGPIDEYFGHTLGRLPCRSLRFETETLDQEYFQPVVQVNYPNDHDYTRIVEIKHVTGQKSPRTTIVREYPQDEGPSAEPYYPVPNPENQALYEKYRELAEREESVSFVGRLATYRYYNMDQVIGMALAEFERLRGKLS